MWFLLSVFQLFSPLFRFLFHLSFTVLVHYRLICHIIFRGWSPLFQSRLLAIYLIPFNLLLILDFHLLWIHVESGWVKKPYKLFPSRINVQFSTILKFVTFSIATPITTITYIWLNIRNFFHALSLFPKGCFSILIKLHILYFNFAHHYFQNLYWFFFL